MFGYVIPNKGELKVKELEEYQGWYCGLCVRLQRDYGFLGRLSLNYDMTFLAVLLSSLYDTDIEKESGRCLVHPLQKRCRYDSSYVSYAAAMNVLLTYYKCVDDWKDDREYLRGAYGVSLRRAERQIAGQYPDKADHIKECLEELGQAELRGETSLDIVSGIFGRICGEIFVPNRDIWYEDLYHMGFYLGKYIYLLDAWDDLTEDYHNKSYNPFLASCGEITDIEAKRDDDRESVKQILIEMISRACYHFERLPLVDNVEILRNILYSGVWTKFGHDSSRQDEGRPEMNTDNREWREEG